MRKRTIILIVVLVIIILIAVAAIQVYSLYSAAIGLSISISKVSATNVGVTSATVLVTLAFVNPSGTALPPVQVNFSAFLGGRYIGNGTLPQVTIESNTVTQQTVGFNVTYISVATGAITSLVHGQYNITAIGKARVMVLASLIPITVGFTVNQYCNNLRAQNCTQTHSIS
jgi:hypothetical protein